MTIQPDILTAGIILSIFASIIACYVWCAGAMDRTRDKIKADLAAERVSVDKIGDRIKADLLAERAVRERLDERVGNTIERIQRLEKLTTQDMAKFSAQISDVALKITERLTRVETIIGSRKQNGS